MKPVLMTSLALVALTVTPASAQKKVDGYYSDPPYEAIGEASHHPMQELMDLAKEDGNERAMYILADLYEKGKGGMKRDEKRALELFEKSALGGFRQSLVRLAAIAKKRGDVLEAYKWYSLAIERFPDPRNEDTYKYLVKQRDELVKKNDLSDGQIREAKRNARDWKRKKNSKRS